MLEEFGPSLYLADGPVVSFYGFPDPNPYWRSRVFQMAGCGYGRRLR